MKTRLEGYIFDTGIFIDLFRYYYRGPFPSLWEKFDNLINQGTVLSVDEVLSEINEREDLLKNWAKENKSIFQPPTNSEFEFIKEIFKIPHFQSNISIKDRLKEKPVADTFVIAKAKYLKRGVVTLEKRGETNLPRYQIFVNILVYHASVWKNLWKKKIGNFKSLFSPVAFLCN